MVSFRKLVMVMVLLVIVAGLAVAQQALPPIVSCQTYNQQTARLRSEGVTELIPNITLVCMSANQVPNSGDPATAGTLYDWFVYFPANAPLTSSSVIDKKHGNATEPQLFVEVVPVVGGTPQTSEGIFGPYYAAKINAGNASSGGSVEFDTVDMNPEGDNSVYNPPNSQNWNNVYITITGLRVDALGLASTGPLVTPNALTLTLFSQPSQTTNAANQQNPGNVFLPPVNGVQQYTLSVSLGYSAPSLTVTENGQLDWRQCFKWEDLDTNGYQYFWVNFTELYSYAFAPPTDGFENTPAPTPNGGTRLFFTFSNSGESAWPAFVKIQVPDGVEVLEGDTTVVVRALLVLKPNPDGSGGTVVDEPTVWTSDNMPDSNHLWGGDWNTVDTSPTGSNMVVYEIEAGALPAVTTTLTVPVQGSLIDTPTIYPIPDGTDNMVSIVQAGYAPWTPASKPQPGPIPRFHGPASFKGDNLLVIEPCVTNLLYPYVVAGQGWDTGLTVANTGWDPFTGNWPFASNEPSATPAVPGTSANLNNQPGVCNIYFYGSIDRGAPLVTKDNNPPAPIVLGASGFGSKSATGDDPTDYIQPGTTSEDLVMAVLALNNPAVDFTKHSWNGYAIAVCNFLYAHGYAFTVFHDATHGNLSLGYLALVFDQRGQQHPSQRPEKMTF